MITTEPRKYTVIYARYSSSAQTEQSIEGQLSVCYDYAEKNGFTVIGEYIDRAISGRSDDRPEFLRMMADAKKGGFQFILVYKLDRFARNRYDSAVYKHQLKKYGVKVISAMEAIGDNPEAILLEALLEASAEYYSVDLSQKVRRGRKESARKGRYVDGGVPLGYKTEDGRLVVDEKTAPIVRIVFEEYAAGTPLQQIVDKLNASGYRNRKGNPFSKSSFWRMIQNEKYLGILDQEGFRFEDAHPALVSQETFQKAQERLTVNRKHGARNKAAVPYLLSGKLFCGCCGAPMVGVSGTGKTGKKWFYYSCQNKRKKKCDKKHEKKDFLEWYVCEQTMEYVLSPDRIRLIAQRLIRIYEDDFSETEVKALEKQIRSVETEINKILELMIEVPEAARPALQKKLTERCTVKESLEVDLAKLRVARKVRLTEDDVVRWLSAFCSGDLFDMAFRERLIDVFIGSVYLWDDKVVIYYNVKDGEQISYIDVLEDLKDAPSPDADLGEGAPSDAVRISPPGVSQSMRYTNPVFFYHRGSVGLMVQRN